MTLRFVVVPGIPRELSAIRTRGRFYTRTEANGFDIYDNKEKCRLPLAFLNREDANVECGVKNAEQLFDSKY